MSSCPPLPEWALILVSPKGALNVGGVARLMGNFGLKDLRLVEPRCDIESLECKQMAMQSYSLIREAKHFKTLSDAIADRSQVIALSGRSVDGRRPAGSLYQMESAILPHFRATDKVALVFGREEMGLLLEELCLCQWQILIPTSEQPSINLTSAAAIALSKLFEWDQKRNPQVQRAVTSEIERPPRQVVNLFFTRLHQLLVDVKFNNKENPEMLRDDLWALFHRADLDDREMRILFGILTAVETGFRQKQRIDA